MINIHWSWLVFVPVVILLVIGVVKNKGDFNIIGPFLFVLLIAFILIFGGIFWW